MMERGTLHLYLGNETLFQMLISSSVPSIARTIAPARWMGGGRPRHDAAHHRRNGHRAYLLGVWLVEASPNVAINDWRDDASLRVGGYHAPA